MPAIITQHPMPQNAEISRHIERSTSVLYSQDYVHRWNFDNFATDLPAEIPEHLEFFTSKKAKLYNYNGLTLQIGKRPRGSRTVTNRFSALRLIVVAHQFMMIQSTETGRFLAVNHRNRVISTEKPTAAGFWFEDLKTETHRNFHTFTNRNVNKNGELCNLSIDRRGKVKCKTSIRSRSTSFLPLYFWEELNLWKNPKFNPFEFTAYFLQFLNLTATISFNKC